MSTSCWLSCKVLDCLNQWLAAESRPLPLNPPFAWHSHRSCLFLRFLWLPCLQLLHQRPDEFSYLWLPFSLKTPDWWSVLMSLLNVITRAHALQICLPLHSHIFFFFFMLSPFLSGQSLVLIPLWLTWSALRCLGRIVAIPVQPGHPRFTQEETLTTDSWESTGQPVIIFLFVWSLISPTDLNFSRTQLLFIPFCFYWSWLVWS